MAKDDPKRLFDRNYINIYLEKYVTKTKQKFNVIENYKVPLYEEDKARQLLDNTNCPKNYLKTEVNICRSSHSASSKTSSTYLSTVISRLFPETHP